MVTTDLASRNTPLPAGGVVHPVSKCFPSNTKDTPLAVKPEYGSLLDNIKLDRRYHEQPVGTYETMQFSKFLFALNDPLSSKRIQSLPLTGIQSRPSFVRFVSRHPQSVLPLAHFTDTTHRKLSDDRESLPLLDRLPILPSQSALTDVNGDLMSPLSWVQFEANMSGYQTYVEGRVGRRIYFVLCDIGRPTRDHHLHRIKCLQDGNYYSLEYGRRPPWVNHASPWQIDLRQFMSMKDSTSMEKTAQWRSVLVREHDLL